MIDDSGSLASFSGKARLFPLPNLVLFPSVMQPLHIFEPRYRQMMTDALEDDRLLALAMLKPGWEEDYHKKPPIYPVVCLGQIYKEERLPDGRFNLLLHGLKRAQILEELPSQKLYRIARVQLLNDVAPTSADRELLLRTQLGEQMETWFIKQNQSVDQLETLLKSSLALGALCDIFSFALPLPIEVKQGLLEEVNVESRARRLQEFLEPNVEKGPENLTKPRTFPPDFSNN